MAESIPDEAELVRRTRHGGRRVGRFLLQTWDRLSYEYANQLILGLARARAPELGAALFALDVTEAVNGTDWVGAGFSFPLLLRTALHYGPMYPVFDPIAQREGVSGAHIAQAARLEPHR